MTVMRQLSGPALCMIEGSTSELVLLEAVLGSGSRPHGVEGIVQLKRTRPLYRPGRVREASGTLGHVEE